MSDPYIGELRAFPFNFSPKGWAPCNGQLLAINQNQALFALLGVTYGGDGRTTFALPDLRGRTPVGAGNGYTFGQVAGAELLPLNLSQMPAHVHQAFGSTTSVSTGSPGSGVMLGTFDATQNYVTTTATGSPALSGLAVSYAGAGQGHENRQPLLALNVCIALVGIYPPRN